MTEEERTEFADFLAGIFAAASARRAEVEARAPILWRHRSGVVVDVARRRIVRAKA